MKTQILNSWTEIPHNHSGMQVWKFDNPETAFKYAEMEFLPYGYAEAFFILSTKTLHIYK